MFVIITEETVLDISPNHRNIFSHVPAVASSPAGGFVSFGGFETSNLKHLTEVMNFVWPETASLLL